MKKPSIVDTDYLFISNAHKNKMFYISSDETPSSNNRHCGESLTYAEQNTPPFTCIASWADGNDDIAINDIFDVRPTYDDFKPVCKFLPKELSTSNAKILSILDRTISLLVNLADKKSNVNWESELVHIRFIPNIFVDEATLSLSRSQTTQSIDVFGSESQLSGLKVCFFNNLLRSRYTLVQHSTACPLADRY